MVPRGASMCLQPCGALGLGRRMWTSVECGFVELHIDVGEFIL